MGYTGERFREESACCRLPENTDSHLPLERNAVKMRRCGRALRLTKKVETPKGVTALSQYINECVV